MIFPETRIVELRKQITIHNQNYYQYDKPSITDSEYDALIRELIELETSHPELELSASPTQQVSGALDDRLLKAKHLTPMISLGNAFNESELRSFDARIKKTLQEENVEYICELKIDGLAVNLLYERGRLICATTRGDGEYGEDVTANVLTISSIPRVIIAADFPELIEIRGEVYMPRASFARLNSEREENGEPTFANPRNAAAGSLRQLDSNITAGRALEAFFYACGDNANFASHGGFLTRLADWGFNVNENYSVCVDINSVIEFVSGWAEKRHSSHRHLA